VVSGIGITAGAGDLAAGSVVTLTVNLSEAVTVMGGVPTLTLNDGGNASYTGGSGSNALTFSYTVAAGQNTSDLTVTGLALNGATIYDGAGNNSVLSGAVRNPAGTLKVDTKAPVVTKVVAFPATGDITTGHTARITLDMSEAVSVGGSPVLLLNDGATASYDVARSSSKALVFDYQVAAGQVTTDLVVAGIDLPSASSIQDLAGNTADLSGAGANLGLQINTHSTGAAAPSGGNYTITGNSELELFGPSTASVGFAASSTGTLKLDDSQQFSGTVAGLTTVNALDLADINFATVQTPVFSGDPTHGTLTVNDGSHIANIALSGDYTLATWTPSDDGRGGTNLVDPPMTSNSALASFVAQGGSSNGTVADVPWGLPIGDPGTLPAGAQDIIPNLALLSNYMANAFTPWGFGGGGTPQADPTFSPPAQLPFFTQPASQPHV